MRKPIKYVEKVAVAAAKGAWVVFDRFNQRARPERIRRELRVDRIVRFVRGVRVEPILQPEHDFENVIEPQPGRRAAEEMEILRQ